MNVPRSLRLLLLGLWIVALAMLGTVLWINARLNAPPPGIPVGAPVSDFSLKAQDGRTFRIADYRGRPLFLAFVPDLGVDTRVQARSLAASMARFEESGGKVFLIVETDQRSAQALHAAERLPYPILLDEHEAVARTFGVPKGGRQTVVVGPSGKVAYHIRGVDVGRHGPQVVAISNGCADEVLSARAKGVGEPVADFSLPRAEGGAMTTLYGDRSQKATVALFLSVRCPCSNAYNARVRAFAADYRRRGVRVLAVYSSVDESARDVAEHARAQGFEGFPVLRDERLLGADHLHAGVTPQAFVIDRRGVLRYAGRIDDKREADKVTRHDLRAAVDAVLAGEEPPASTPAFGCAIPRTPAG